MAYNLIHQLHSQACVQCREMKNMNITCYGQNILKLGIQSGKELKDITMCDLFILNIIEYQRIMLLM